MRDPGTKASVASCKYTPAKTHTLCLYLPSFEVKLYISRNLLYFLSENVLLHPTKNYIWAHVLASWRWRDKFKKGMRDFFSSSQWAFSPSELHRQIASRGWLCGVLHPVGGSQRGYRWVTPLYQAGSHEKVDLEGNKCIVKRTPSSFPSSHRCPTSTIWTSLGSQDKELGFWIIWQGRKKNGAAVTVCKNLIIFLFGSFL